MSKIKTPQEKKSKSLKLDPRNAYGENPAASRKGISRGKQRSRMEERRVVTQVLASLRGKAQPQDDVDTAESTAIARGAVSHRHGFKKRPDVPLANMIRIKQRNRASRAKKSN